MFWLVIIYRFLAEESRYQEVITLFWGQGKVNLRSFDFYFSCPIVWCILNLFFKAYKSNADWFEEQAIFILDHMPSKALATEVGENTHTRAHARTHSCTRSTHSRTRTRNAHAHAHTHTHTQTHHTNWRKCMEKQRFWKVNYLLKSELLALVLCLGLNFLTAFRDYRGLPHIFFWDFSDWCKDKNFVWGPFKKFWKIPKK